MKPQTKNINYDTKMFDKFENIILTLSKTLNDNSEYISKKAIEFGALAVNSLKNKHKILTCGNGGSAADALHFACELTGRFLKERQALAAICLNENICALTAIANDYSYSQVFKRQLEALAKSGDLLICYSTSGNSENIIETIAAAKVRGVIVCAVLGKDGGKIKDLADYIFIAPEHLTPRIQEIHCLFNHLICEFIELHFD